VLEKGSSEDEMTAYKRFRGAEPDIQALIKRKGFDQVK
jgi:peptidyl-dipeptidase Dcp